MATARSTFFTMERTVSFGYNLQNTKSVNVFKKNKFKYKIIKACQIFFSNKQQQQSMLPPLFHKSYHPFKKSLLINITSKTHINQNYLDLNQT